MPLEAVSWGISVAGWIMSPIISKLLEKALSYSKKDKANTLHELLTDLLPRLTLTLEAAEASNHRKLFEEMVKGLKSAFYDIEDILDEAEYIRHQKKLDAQAKSDKKKKDKKNVDAKAGPSNKDSSNEVELTITGSLNERLKDNMLKIQSLLDKAQVIIPLATLINKNRKRKRSGKDVIAKDNNTSTPKVKVTGRDKDRDQIAKMLRDTKDDVDPSSSDSKCFSAIGIHGIPGSGKTTLAQHVCKYEEKQTYFDLVIWIPVSQNYRKRDIWKEMYEAASKDKNACPDYNSDNVLEKELEEKLGDKRFLLVLDDIWCDEDEQKLVDDDEQKLVDEDKKQKLVDILSPLNLGKRGSKILATSRDKKAFSDLGPGVACADFPLKSLDDQTFLELFMYYALDSTKLDDSYQTEFRSIGAEIAKKLKGSPLAACMVGGQLRKTTKIDDWIKTRDQDLLNETAGVVYWSYQQLDQQIRRCISYCSIFPRRHSLDRDDLVKLWVAEGFIQTDNPKEDLEVGERYFDELVATSFMQPGESRGGKSCYLLHDLMYDMAEKVAGNDCFRVENGQRRQIPPDVRHIFVADGKMATEKIFELKNLRTLIIHEMKLSESDFKVFLEKVFNNLKKLRVLAVKYTCGEIRELVWEIPDTIGYLKHLRHLDLMFPNVSKSKLILPRTLTNLYHLQCLILKGYEELEFPRDIDMCKLSNLRHMIFAYLGITLPNIGRLTSLQALQCFTVRIQHGYEIKQLGDLNILRGHLTIKGLENVKSKDEAHEANLAAKTLLRDMRLIWNDGEASPQVQAEVIEGLCPPKNLESLIIVGYKGLGYPSWMVGVQNGGPTKYLNTLVLDKCDQLGPAPKLFECFVHLRSLAISQSGWDCLPDNVKDLRSLKILSFHSCPNIKSLPELPRSLEYFQLISCDSDFTESCKQVDHPNWQKLQHVKDCFLE